MIVMEVFEHASYFQMKLPPTLDGDLTISVNVRLLREVQVVIVEEFVWEIVIRNMFIVKKQKAACHFFTHLVDVLASS